MKPLDGLRVVEFEGLGPGPLAGRMLADLGATVIVVVRPSSGGVAERLGGAGENPLRRGKQVLTLDLKQADQRAHALELVSRADALLEGNRPGVMERLGLGPSACAERNPALAVLGRKVVASANARSGTLAASTAAATRATAGPASCARMKPMSIFRCDSIDAANYSDGKFAQAVQLSRESGPIPTNDFASTRRAAMH